MALVLVVDDEPDVRLALTAQLEMDDHTVLEAADGARVLALARERQPDLVLLDVTMPGLDGFEVLKLLKADPKTIEIPVIMVTARTQAGDRERGRQLGACDYIGKPWSDGEVELRVEWALKMRSEGRGAQGALDISHWEATPTY